MIFEKILQYISGGVLYIVQGTIVYANPAALEILNKNEDELLNLSFAEVFFEYSENDDFNQMLLDVIYDKNWRHENIVQYFDGQNFRNLHVLSSVLKNENEFGIVLMMDDVTELLRLRGIALDIDKIKRINEQLKVAAETDRLTNLFNKSTMENLCREHLSKLSAGEKSALYVIDLDHFKEANDTYGHQCGDKILQQFADGLKKIFSDNAYIGRFGGDEFVILVKNFSNENEITDRARKILQTAMNISIDNMDLQITASIGISIAKIGDDYTQTFKRSDESLYIVKSQGRNNFHMHA